MLLAALRRRDTPVGDLARVLAAWLVVILLAQGLAALQTLVRGPAHRHLSAAGAAASHPAHDRAHALGQAHHHAAGELAVPADAEAGLDAAAWVLMAALAAVAVSYEWAHRGLQSAAMTSIPWAFAEREEPPPRRPPRG